MTTPRRIFDDQLYAHFVTFSVCDRRRLLDQDQPKRIVLDGLKAQLVRSAAKCIGFVLMPDHVHANVWFPQPNELSRFMHGWKRIASFHVREWYRSRVPNYVRGFGEGDKFWQPKYYSYEIYERAKLEEKLNYMHENPVRAGLVDNPADWKWSSARWYESREPVGVPLEWVD